MYQLLFGQVFTRMDPEKAHTLASRAIELLGRTPVVNGIIQGVLAPYLQTNSKFEVFGRRIPGPFGLAGGFDKNAKAIRGLSALGFGFVEIGTVTAYGQPGNPKPRMWREVGLKGIRNQMGFNNSGATEVEARLAEFRSTKYGKSVFVGVNIGKTKITPASGAAADYATSASLLAPYADYLVVNVSSPNTPGLRDLQSAPALREILIAVQEASARVTVDQGKPRVPLLVKIAPDLANEDIVDICKLAVELNLDGVSAVNTTINHDLGPGGLSGGPLLQRGLEVVTLVREHLGPDKAIIASGGILSTADAQRYLDAGANLTQGYTGFIYNGPFWPSKVNRGLIKGKK